MTSTIPAITLWQPWASLIQIGVKPFETRSWPTRYRGPIAIHAGVDRRGLNLCRGEPEIEDALAASGLALTELPRGCIVAVAELVACWPTEAIVADDLADAFGDYGPGRHGWYLHRVRQLPEPLRCLGRQGLWRPPRVIQQRLVAFREPKSPLCYSSGKH